MEKFFLCPFFFGNELNIVDEEHVNVPVFVAEFLVFVVLDGQDQLVGEGFAGNVEHLRCRILIQYKVGNGMHQVGFAQPGVSVQK